MIACIKLEHNKYKIRYGQLTHINQNCCWSNIHKHGGWVSSSGKGSSKQVPGPLVILQMM